MSSLQIEMLTEDEDIVRLCREYWNCDEAGKFATSVTQVAREHGVKSGDLSKIVTANSIAFSRDNVCYACQQPFILQNRSSYTEFLRWPERKQICSTCHKQEVALQNSLREAKLRQQRELIRNAFNLEPATPDIQSLDLEDVVLLVSFIRVAASDDLTIYGPINKAEQRLSPSADFDIAVLKHLYTKRLILIHPDSAPIAFNFENDIAVPNHWDALLFALPTGSDLQETRNFIEATDNVLREKALWPKEWHEQTLALWRQIALQECLEYLELALTQRLLPFNATEKTQLVLSSLLERFSTAQICNMIWTCASRAVDYQVRERITKTHTANIAVSNLQNYSDRALAEGWIIKQSRRDFKCPQSIISQVAYNLALGIGDRGFNEVPTSIRFDEPNNGSLTLI